MERKRVLVVGGSGYLGQHLLQALAAERSAGTSQPFDLAFTHYRSTPPPELLGGVSPVLPFRVDMRTGEGFQVIGDTFGQPQVVVNCAALSVPRACETDPAAAMAINVPTSLVTWLASFANDNTLLIHLSTDQVYEGIKSFYKEEDEAVPVNMYGRSKLAAEQHIVGNCSNFAILRSSIIYGPQTVSPVTKSLPIQGQLLQSVIPRLPISAVIAHIAIKPSSTCYCHLCGKALGWLLRAPEQWIDSSLSRSQEVEFFFDEFRCPIYVKDVVIVILALAKKWISDRAQIQLLLNVGGPDRVSRVQMAETVADVRGHQVSLIKPVPASSVDRGVVSPVDISMNISKLIEAVGITPVSFKDGVSLTLSAGDDSSPS